MFAQQTKERKKISNFHPRSYYRASGAATVGDETMIGL